MGKLRPGTSPSLVPVLDDYLSEAAISISRSRPTFTLSSQRPTSSLDSSFLSHPDTHQYMPIRHWHQVSVIEHNGTSQVYHSTHRVSVISAGSSFPGFAQLHVQPNHES